MKQESPTISVGLEGERQSAKCELPSFGVAVPGCFEEHHDRDYAQAAQPENFPRRLDG